MSEALSDFVRDSIRAGQSREAVEADLRAAGWSEGDIARATGAWDISAAGLPVPRPKPYVSAREAFVYGLMFIALVISTVALADLMFDIIDRYVDDPYRDDRFRNSDNSRWNIALLVVFFPTFALLSWRTNARREADARPRPSVVRKWIGYLGLFGASLALLGAGVSVIYGFLDGALTLRFLLKSASVAAIAGAVFAYYRSDTLEDRDG